MPLEIELKYLDADHGALRVRLAALGAERIGRWFEANAVYDLPGRVLKAQGCLLRLRTKGATHVLTLKKRLETPYQGQAKAYDETETSVADAGAMAAILEGLGYALAFRYEKIREKWKLLGCEVCLDTLPFGFFVEIEGAEEDIRASAEALGLPPEKASTATYHELNRRRCEERGLGFEESFVFAGPERERLLKEVDAAPLDSRPSSA